MTYDFTPQGVCSKNIRFEIDGNIVKKVEFFGGCPGNATGISRLVEGMEVQEVIDRLQGIRCGNKFTSCPDQLSIALRLALQKQAS